MDLHKQEQHLSTSFNTFFSQREEQREVHHLVPKSNLQQESYLSLGADFRTSISENNPSSLFSVRFSHT